MDSLTFGQQAQSNGKKDKNMKAQNTVLTTNEQFVTQKMIDFLPIADVDKVQAEYSDKVRFSPYNSKVFQGVYDAIIAIENGTMENIYPFDVTDFITDILAYFNTPRFIKKYGKMEKFSDIPVKAVWQANKSRNWIVSYGQPAIQSCPNAGRCMVYCYAYASERNYDKSELLHEHNYHITFGLKSVSMLDLFQNGLDNRTRVVRINDCGDVHTYEQMKTWYQMAINNPKVLFYGYTKMSGYLLKLINEYGSLPNNLRVSVSETDNPVSVQFRDKLVEKYPQYTSICWIIDTMERVENNNLPYNNEERQAQSGWTHGAHNFAIGLHLGGTQKAYVTDEEWTVSMHYEKMSELNPTEKYC